MRGINIMKKSEVFIALSEKFGNQTITRKDIQEYLKSINLLDGVASAGAMTRFLGDHTTKVGHGQYQLSTNKKGKVVETKIPSEVKTTPQVKVSNNENQAVNLMVNTETQNLIPSHFEGFVPWGHCATIKKVIKSKMFYPVFITGLSGNGKTLMVEELHSQLKRELIRVNITIETDEDDLLGGFRLINGETKFVPGPVIQAMERGCTLLLDECDLGSNKLLALQPVLEGKGVFLKKINKWVTPKPGFNVIATANTKGKGSDDGRFVGTNVLNEAFLERFPVTFEQEYPTATVETKILLANGCDQEFTELLVKWAGIIRKTFYDGGVDEVVTTRRLVHIAKAFAIFGNRLTAVTNCISRFDEDTKQSFLDLYTKVDAGEDMEDDQEPDGDVSF